MDNPAAAEQLCPKVIVWEEGSLPKCEADNKEEDGQNI